jgi:hypothetical protein
MFGRSRGSAPMLYTPAMIPDPATIARRRHIATIVVRSLIVMYAGWVMYDLLGEFKGTMLNLWSGGMGGGSLYVMSFAASLAVGVISLAAIIFFERTLVRWIVPMPRRDAGCPACGYSLKDLKSPICPECGTNLRG